MYYGFWPAKVLSYDQDSHTAQIHVPGLTDGLAEGITADFGYPVGDDDRDTERQILPGADVDVYFERGQQEAPIIAFYRSHRVGGAKDTRRIRQKNIELLATSQVRIKAPELIIEANLKIIGDITHQGNQLTTGTISADQDVKSGEISLVKHLHDKVRSGAEKSGKPQQS